MAAFLAAAAVACYANALPNPFVFDDLEAIVTNPHITSLTPISNALSAPTQSAVAGRPLVSLSLALNYAAGGLAPAGYRAWNVAVHVLCALMLAAIVRWTLTRLPIVPSRQAVLEPLRAVAAPLAAVVALLWLVHPLQTELVDYVVQRSESMMALCYFAALYASLRVMSGGEGKWTVAAIACGAFGMACKEAMVTAPFVILVFDAVFVAGSLPRAVRARPALYGGLAATWLVLAWLNLGGPRWRSAGFSTGVSPWTYLLHQGEMIVTYLKLTVWPHPLILDYGLTSDIQVSQALPYVLIVGALALLTVVALWRVPIVGFLGAWFFITLSPASSVVPVLTEVGAERRMYLPLAGVVTLVVCGAWWMLGRFVSNEALRRRAAAGLAVVAALALGVITVRRNADYRDLTTLWRGVVAARPSGRAHYNLGIEYKKRNRLPEAMEQYRQAAGFNYPAAHYALGFEAREAGRHEESVRELRQFAAEAPHDAEVPNVYVMLGKSLASLGRLDESIDAFKTAVTMRPSQEDARGGLADVLLAASRYTEAVAAFQAYLQLAPSNATAWGNLGKAFIGLDRPSEAANAFARAVQLAPTDSAQRLNHGYALSTLGRWDEASAAFQAVLRQSPDHVPALAGLGVALAAQGQRERAIAAFTRAIQLDPTNAQVRADAAAALGSRAR